MKITEVRTIALSGATQDHGWPGGTEPDEQRNTLLEVRTDEGLTGIGSCYTSRALVEASLELLHPMLIGETGLEAERVAEKLRQMTFWQGRGGAVEHAISGIDIALWDLQGQALGQPVSRLLGGNYRDRIKPYASILFEDPPVLRDRLLAQVARGFRAIKMGWRPFGRVSRKLDELLIKTARETVGRGRRADGGRGRQRAVLAARRLLGPRDRQDAGRLRHRLVRGGAAPGRRHGLQGAPPDLPRPRRHRRGPDAPPGVPALSHRARGRRDPARRDEVRRALGEAAASAGWRRTTASSSSLTAGTRASAWPRTSRSRAAMPVARWIEYQTGVPYIEEIIDPPFQLDDEGMLRVPTGPGLGVQLNWDAVGRYTR